MKPSETPSKFPTYSLLFAFELSWDLLCSWEGGVSCRRRHVPVALHKGWKYGTVPEQGPDVWNNDTLLDWMEPETGKGAGGF